MPALQELQLAWPVWAWYVPARQFRQVVWEAWGWYFPLAHTMQVEDSLSYSPTLQLFVEQVVDPVLGANWPASQVIHVASAVCPVPAEYLPLAHWMQTDSVVCAAPYAG